MSIVYEKDKRKSINIFFLILVFVKFFGIILLRYHFLNYILLPCLLYFVVKASRLLSTKEKKLYIIYIIFIVISCINSFYINGQNIFKTFVASFDYLGILSFFLLAYYNLSFKLSENILLKIAILFVICYLIQYLIYPIVIFSGALNDLNINASEFRMRMSGSACSYLLYYYSLNKFLLKKNIKYCALMLFSLIPIFIMGFRTLSILTLFFSIIMVLNIPMNLKHKITMIMSVGLLLLLIINIPIFNSKINEMNDRSESGQTFLNPDYIRFKEFDYYVNEIFTSPLEIIFGAGVPVFDNSTEYSKAMDEASEKYMFWSDLGLVGLCFLLGIPAICMLILIIFRCAIRCKSKEILYIRYTLLTILIGSILTTAELYRPGNLVIIGVILYIEYKFNERKILGVV